MPVLFLQENITMYFSYEPLKDFLWRDGETAGKFIETLGCTIWEGRKSSKLIA